MNYSNAEWIEYLSPPGDPEAIAELNRRLVRALQFSLSGKVPESHLEALNEEIAQEAVIRILDNLSSFRGESQFLTWATKIAVRLAYSELRRNRWKDISIEDVLPPDSDNDDFTPSFLADPGATPEKAAEQNALISIVQRIIEEELTQKQKDAILAVLSGGMPLEEVADRMGSNRNALYKLIHDARIRLRDRLNKEGISVKEILGVFS
jgi:RNA polymerase sigma-70 factor (ECF subfamily)